MNLIILYLLVYPLEPYLWATCMKQLGYKYTKYRYTYQFTFLGYYGITLIKQLFIGNLHNDILNTVFSIGLAIYMVACTLILYEGKTSKKLVWVSTFFGLIFLTELIMLGFSTFVLHESTTIYSTPNTTVVICTLIAKILLFVACQLVYFRKDGTLVNSLLENKEIIPLALLTILFELPASAIIKSINVEHNSVAIGICAGIQALLILLTLYVFFIINKRNSQYKYIKAELENNKRSDESIDKFRKLRHDINGHANIMYTLCKNKQYDLLEKYILKNYEVSQVPSAVFNTFDPALSILLGDMKRKAIDLNIRADFLITTHNVTLNSYDVCTLTHNLLKNAIEGTSKLPAEYSRIEYTIKPIIDGYTISCENTAPLGTTLDKTTKKDKSNHGYGLKIIKGLAKRNRGKFWYNIEQEENYCTVFIGTQFVYTEKELKQFRQPHEQEQQG